MYFIYLLTYSDDYSASDVIDIYLARKGVKPLLNHRILQTQE